ncbi:MAG: T9SS type A sorting domain-containing protein [Bacteroidales bacterium]
MIQNNQTFIICEVQSICDYLTSSNGEVEIWGNAPGCNSPEEIDSLCNITVVQNFYEEYEILISPNPINIQAVLSFNLTTPRPVDIRIYNTTGICLNSWQFQNQQPGQKEFKLDLKDLQAGIYFCQVQIGNKMVTKKIIKTK